MSNKNFILILEAGVNHEGHFKNAVKLVEAAAESGADYIKFQSYTSNHLAAKNSPSYWDVSEEPIRSQAELFSKYDSLTCEDYYKLAKVSKSLGIGFMSTCFDSNWVDLLDPILTLYKIASADINNFQLISKIASKNKPIVLSTGAATFTEIQSAITLIRKLNSKKITLLHCVLNYPTASENASLGRITSLARAFPEQEIGYSDHTKPGDSMQAIQIAYNLGAKVFEKHFTLDKSQKGNDHYHSFDKTDAKEIISRLNSNYLMADYNEHKFMDIQLDARKNARRGLYAFKELAIGHVITDNDIIPLRPTLDKTGYNADQINLIVGKIVKKKIPAGEPILESFLN